jgi:hypothetical protein
MPHPHPYDVIDLEQTSRKVKMFFPDGYAGYAGAIWQILCYHNLISPAAAAAPFGCATQSQIV